MAPKDAKQKGLEFLNEQGDLRVTLKGSERPEERSSSSLSPGIVVAMALAGSLWGSNVLVEKVKDFRFSSGAPQVIYDASIDMGAYPTARTLISQADLDSHRLVAILDRPDSTPARHQITPEEFDVVDQAADYVEESRDWILTGVSSRSYHSDTTYPVASKSFWKDAFQGDRYFHEGSKLVSAIYLDDPAQTGKHLQEHLEFGRSMQARIDAGKMDPRAPGLSSELRSARHHWQYARHQLGENRSPDFRWDAETVMDLTVTHELAHVLLEHSPETTNAHTRAIEQFDASKYPSEKAAAQGLSEEMDSFRESLDTIHEREADAVMALMAFKTYGDDARAMIEDWRDFRWAARYHFDEDQQDRTHYTSRVLQKILDAHDSGANLADLTVDQILKAANSIRLTGDDRFIAIDLSAASNPGATTLKNMINIRNDAESPLSEREKPSMNM